MNPVTGLGRLGRLAVTPAYIKPAKGAILFLHGTCDSGPGLQRWVNQVLEREFNFYHHSILFPTAPSRPYELLNGQVACVWFNRLKLSPEVPEDNSSIERAALKVGKLVLDETTREGIPLSKVVLGGFSQGGTLALHLAYRFYPEVAGCFALSSFLPPDSKVYDRLDALKEDRLVLGMETAKETGSAESQSQLPPPSQIPQNPTATTETKLPVPVIAGGETWKTAKLRDSTKTKREPIKLPRLFMSHGTHDPLIQHSWAKSTFSKLRDNGVDGNFYTVPNGEHRIHQQQLQILHGWIESVLRDTEKGTGRVPPPERPQPSKPTDNLPKLP